jgi:transcription initiation factor IIE alpha subunit
MDILSDRRKKKKWPIKYYYVNSRHGNVKCERDSFKMAHEMEERERRLHHNLK